MKKALKILGLIVLLILLLAVSGFIYINASGIPSYEKEPLEYTAVSSPEALERGKKLALMLCANCHLDEKTGRLTGIQMLDAPVEFGTIYSPNITQDKTHGIGNWSDADLVYLLRTGIKKDGQYAPPYMAKLPLMADSDINAIISFLRSDHDLVRADPTPDRAPEVTFLTKFLTRVAFKPLPLPDGPISLPDGSDPVALGKYLAMNLDCFSCHSADFKTNDFLNPENSEGYFGGGNKTLDKQGRIKVTSNLTPHKETGIGNWSKEKFIKAVKSGIKEGEPALSYPMAPYSLLTDEEVGAIFEYLQTIPPIEHKVTRSIYESD